jgi:hypothetical protein
MWTPTTRMHHSRPVTRYQIDLTDAEWRVIAPHQSKIPRYALGLLSNCEISQKRKAGDRSPSVQQNRCLDGCSSIAGADVGIEARPPF